MFKPSGTSANILHAHIAHRLKTRMPRLSCRCTHPACLLSTLWLCLPRLSFSWKASFYNCYNYILQQYGPNGD